MTTGRSRGVAPKNACCAPSGGESRTGRPANRRSNDIATHLSLLREELMEHPYPFAHASERATLGRYLIPRRVQPDNVSDTWELAHIYFQNVGTLYFRAMGRLMTIAQKIEGLLKVSGDPPKPPMV